MHIKIELISDLCSGSGESIPGLVDIDITYDEYGIPYIPARRLKGTLREAALEVIEALPTKYDRSFLDDIFGVPGSNEPGMLKLGNATIADYEKLVEDISNAKLKTNYLEFFHKKRILDHYTTIRTQTSIDRENGAAKKDTLRSMRSIKKGNVFYAKVQFDGDISLYQDFLATACKVLRYMGVSRTRGFGQVKCTLVYEQETLKNNVESIFDLANDASNSIYRLEYSIKLLSQAFLGQHLGNSTKSNDYISGSTMLGAFASKYVKKYALGQEAHFDSTFRNIFLTGKVQFSNCYPYRKGRTYHPTPVTFVQEKEGSEYYDLANDKDYEKVLEKELQTTKVSGYYHFKDEGKFDTYSPLKEIEYHHRRANNRSYGHALKDGNGEFFQFEVIKKGEEFSGVITGELTYLKILADLIQKNAVVRIGRSKTAQYAEAEIKVKKLSPIEKVELDEERLIITLESPMILRDPVTGFIQANPQYFVKLIEERWKGAKVIRSFVSTTMVSGFNAKWMLPKIQYPALDAGSVFVFSVPRQNISDFIEVETLQFGLGTAEGFGKVVINTHGENKIIKVAIDHNERGRSPQHEVTKRLLTSIQIMMLKEKIKHRAMKVLENSKKDKLTLTNSSISRLNGVLANCQTKEEFKKFIEEQEQKNNKRLKDFIDFYHKYPFEKQLDQAWSGELTPEAQNYRQTEKDKLFKLFYETIFIHLKWQNRQKKVSSADDPKEGEMANDK
jgi:CRISPR-associated protein Csx10